MISLFGLKREEKSTLKLFSGAAPGTFATTSSCGDLARIFYYGTTAGRNLYPYTRFISRETTYAADLKPNNFLSSDNDALHGLTSDASCQPGSTEFTESKGNPRSRTFFRYPCSAA